MLAGLIVAFGIFFAAASGINCENKGYDVEQCGESLRNERLVTDPR